MCQKSRRQAEDDFVELLSSVINEIKQIGKVNRNRTSTTVSAHTRERLESNTDRQASPTINMTHSFSNLDGNVIEGQSCKIFLRFFVFFLRKIQKKCGFYSGFFGSLKNTQNVCVQ